MSTFNRGRSVGRSFFRCGLLAAGHPMADSSSSTSSRSTSLPKELFGYDVLRVIGAGAGSRIYACSDRKTNQIYALKHVTPRTTRTSASSSSSRPSTTSATRFATPVFAAPVELKINRSLLFRKVTEAGAGAGAVRRRAAGTDHLPRSIADVVRRLHPGRRGAGRPAPLGYVHCDLKPNNILLSSTAR